MNHDEEVDQVKVVGTGSRSFLGVPILAGDKAIGAISVQSTRRGPLQPRPMRAC